MVNAQEYINENYPKGKRKNITNLPLDGKNLEGNLDLSDFVNVTEVNLNSNQISSLNVEGLKKLRTFYLHGNKINDLNLTSCHEIYDFNCNSNIFTSLGFLDTLPNPEKLGMLYINNNNISSDLTPFSKFTNLWYLNLGNHGSYDEGKRIGEKFYNDFHGSLEPLKNLTNLRTLEIYGTDIDSGLEYLPDSINKFEYSYPNERENAKVKTSIEKVLNKYFKGSLREFKNFIKNPPNDSAQEWLNKNYPENEGCKIETKNKGRDGSDGWNNLNKKRAEIEHLDISYSEGGKQLKGVLIFKGFTNLKRLNCSGHQLTHLFLGRCPNLTELKCNNNAFEGLSCLNSLTKLEVLWIQNNKKLLENSSDKTLSLFTSFKKLKELDVSDCPFEGSLKPLEELEQLELLDISHTDISEGLEYLPSSCEKIYCELDYNSKTMEIIKELGKSVKEKDAGYNLNKWRINQTNQKTTSAIPLERLFVIRGNLKQFITKWGKEVESDKIEKFAKKHIFRQVEPLNKLDDLQGPEQFGKHWYWTFPQYGSYATAGMGGVLTLFGKYADQGELIGVGGALSAASPVVSTITTKLKNSFYSSKQEKWKEFLVDADTFSDNFNELLGMTKSIKFDPKLGEVNKEFGNLKDRIERFLDEYDQDGDQEINLEELTDGEKRTKLAQDLNVKEVGELQGIIDTMKELEKKVIAYRQRNDNEKEAVKEEIVQTETEQRVKEEIEKIKAEEKEKKKKLQKHRKELENDCQQIEVQLKEKQENLDFLKKKENPTNEETILLRSLEKRIKKLEDSLSETKKKIENIKSKQQATQTENPPSETWWEKGKKILFHRKDEEITNNPETKSENDSNKNSTEEPVASTSKNNSSAPLQEDEIVATGSTSHSTSLSRRRSINRQQAGDIEKGITQNQKLEAYQEVFEGNK